MTNLPEPTPEEAARIQAEIDRRLASAEEARLAAERARQEAERLRNGGSS
jgi:hypothetical protein